MKIKYLSMIILGIISLLFLLFLLISVMIDRKEKDLVMDDLELMERTHVESFMKINSETIRFFVEDNSYWNEMVAFVNRFDRRWASKNLDDALDVFQVDYLYIYDREMGLTYSLANPTHSLKEIKEIEGAIPLVQLKKMIQQPGEGNKTLHFFIPSNNGPIEFWGAYIRDTGIGRNVKTSPKRGLFLAGRVWSMEFLNRNSSLLGYKLSIVSNPIVDAPVENKKGIVFTTPLQDLSNVPLLYLKVEKDTPLAALIEKYSDQSATYFILFAILMVGSIGVLGYRLILIPINNISNYLQNQNITALMRMGLIRNEFGEMAKIIFRALEYEKEKSKIQLRLFQANKMSAIGSLAAGIAHEINNPLTILVGHLTKINKAIKTSELEQVLQDSWPHLYNGYERIAELVASLKNFARQERAEQIKFDLQVVLVSVLDLLTRIYAKDGIVLKHEFIAKQSMVYGNIGEIKQVFINLLSNARDSIIEKSKIETNMVKQIMVSTKNNQEKNQILISVSDTGNGIPEILVERIFDPYFSTKEKSLGLGLGLTIVHELVVNAHQGKIEVETTEGKGSTFTVTLQTRDQCET